MNAIGIARHACRATARGRQVDHVAPWPGVRPFARAMVGGRLL
jgi:hypothetical protein